MYYHPKRLPANEDRIYKQRQYEEALRARKESVQEYEHLMRCAEFEHSNEPKLNNRSLSERLKSIRDQREAKLNERRKKLAELLENENSMLELELKTCSMNLAERRAWLEERARTLKAQRLQRNQQFAAQQLERAFRENCDDVRIHNSKMAVLRAEEERKKQREFNLQKKLREQEEDRALDKMMEQEWQRHDDLLRIEEERERARNEEAVDILKHQYGLVQRLREEERQAVEDDMREMTARWQREEERLKQSQYEQRRADIQNYKELEEYNDRCKAQKLDEYRQERESDARMAAIAAEVEAAEELQEKKLKEIQKREAMEYADQLKEALDRQKLDDAELEAIIQSEVDDEWQRKDAQMCEQELARSSFYDTIDEQRKAQIRLKERMQMLEEESKKIEYERSIEEMKAMEIESCKKIEEARMSKKDLADALEGQIRSKNEAEYLAKESKKAEFERFKDDEAAYESKVKNALSSCPEVQYRRKTTKWYE